MGETETKKKNIVTDTQAKPCNNAAMPMHGIVSPGDSMLRDPASRRASVLSKLSSIRGRLCCQHIMFLTRCQLMHEGGILFIIGDNWDVPHCLHLFASLLQLHCISLRKAGPVSHHAVLEGVWCRNHQRVLTPERGSSPIA